MSTPEQEKFNSLPEIFFKNARQCPELALYSQFIRSDSHDLNHSLITRTYKEAAQRISIIASYLRSIGVKKGDSVAIISATRPEWLEADLAIMANGAVVVSLYPSLLEAEIAYILYDSIVKCIFVENIEQYQKIKNISERINKIPATEDREACDVNIKIENLISFEEIQEAENVVQFERILKDLTNPQFSHEWYKDLDRSSIASIVYTSGTTGPAKGVVQTHGNHISNIRQAKQGGLYHDSSTMFMLLPLAHSFSKLMGYIGFFAGIHLQFPSISDKNTSKLNQRRSMLDLSSSTCSVIPLVPRILEKMKEGIELQASAKNLKGFLLSKTIKIAAKYKVKKTFARQILFALSAVIRKSIKKKLFGTNFEYVISGGAKLPSEVNQFFADLEIEILEGYGLTETCVATNCNRPGNNRIGTVGPVLADDIELKLSEEGEILFRGPNIAKGYLNQPKATSKAWDSEGWFHTGDLGIISADGYLSISGRKKEIIVTSGGKKISPEKIEAVLKAHDFISQAVIVGEAKPYCVAIVTANKEKLETLLRENSVNTFIELMQKQEIQSELIQHLDKINSELASFETIKKLLWIANDFSIDNGLLTPTLKMKRAQIAKVYAASLEKLYHGNEKVVVESK